MRKPTLLLVSLCAGCIPSAPPGAPSPREATTVVASFARTWDASIDVFAQRNISIKTIDRASGLIVAEPMKVDRGSGVNFADCGTVIGSAIPANTATWNILVRGDSAKATAKATVRFLNVTTGAYGSTTECTSRGVWEKEIEDLVKASAETRKP